MTIRLVAPGGALVTIFEGQVIVGGWVSFTVTVNEQLVVPRLLEAMQVTVEMPSGKVCGEVMTVEAI